MRKSFSVAAGVLQSLYGVGERTYTIFYTSAFADVPVGKFVILNASASYFQQEQPGAAALTSFVLFFGATVQTLPIRFRL
jgi:hypothetical protein